MSMDKLSYALGLSMAGNFLASGIRELIVIAQDVTAYGRDLKRAKGASPLVALLRELDALEEVGGPFWIRLLYGHPNGVTDDLLEWMATSRHACRYLDVPLQHSHPAVLRAMRRADTVALVPSAVAHASVTSIGEWNVVPETGKKTGFRTLVADPASCTSP